ncbi:hypothetical protein ACB094_11G099900 [Castanea mollissima]
MTSDHTMKFIMSHIKGVFLCVCVCTFLIYNDLALLFLIDEHVIFKKVCMVHQYITTLISPLGSQPTFFLPVHPLPTTTLHLLNWGKKDQPIPNNLPPVSLLSYLSAPHYLTN